MPMSDNNAGSDDLERRMLSCIRGRMPFAATPTMDSDLFDELGFDSSLLLDLIITLEVEFGIRFRDEDMILGDLRKPRKLMGLVRSCQERELRKQGGEPV
jgi:acyl carrier protein